MHYLGFLQQVHERLAPRHYLEIGVRWGHSLAVSRCHSVGIDPAFSIDHELHAPVDLFRTTSDAYFAREDPLAPTGGEPFDLAFIDGLHLFEYALRDFINTERHARPGSLVVFDDILPRSVDEAARDRHTAAWTGDVYPILETLRRYRPDILTVCVDTQPTGLLLVMGLDPTSTVLTDHYDEIMRDLRRPDPQPVPPELMERTFVQAPERVLASPLLDVLGQAPDDVDPAELNRRLREVAAAALGPAYA